MAKTILKQCDCGRIYNADEESRIVGTCKPCVSKLDKRGHKARKPRKAGHEDLEKLGDYIMERE